MIRHDFVVLFYPMFAGTWSRASFGFPVLFHLLSVCILLNWPNMLKLCYRSQSRPSSKYTSIFNNNKNKSLTYENTLYFVYFMLLFFFLARLFLGENNSVFDTRQRIPKNFLDRWSILPITCNLYCEKRSQSLQSDSKIEVFCLFSITLYLVQIFNLFIFFRCMCDQYER